MKKVILVRHGKSSWAEPALEDHDRPLNPRGKAAAPVIARWLVARDHRADLVLCSSARRTRDTVKMMARAIPELPFPVVERGLYHASPSQLRERLRKLPDSSRSVMVVGHQPGLSALARKLTNGHVRPRCKRAFDHFPTAAAAVLTFDVPNWREIDDHAGEFVDFARPRELLSQA
ncbi:MAG: histidine phosphatase family protein [Paracoccaceae bacterium]